MKHAERIVQYCRYGGYLLSSQAFSFLNSNQFIYVFIDLAVALTKLDLATQTLHGLIYITLIYLFAKLDIT